MIHCLECGYDADLEEDHCEQCGGALSEPDLADLLHLLEDSRRELETHRHALRAMTESACTAACLTHEAVEQRDKLQNKVEAWQLALAEVVGEENPDILEPDMLENLVEPKEED